MSNIDLARIKDLMNYGRIDENENKQSNYTLEYHTKAADGKEYGIVKECHHFYIKCTDPKKATIAESYNYIGGFNNKKAYEFDSYNAALKFFGEKLASINEAYDGNVNIESLDPYKKNVVLQESTDKMQNQLARFRQIMHNSAVLMNEETEFQPVKAEGNKMVQPEAEKGPKGDKAEGSIEAKPDMEYAGSKTKGVIVSGEMPEAETVKESCEDGACEFDEGLPEEEGVGGADAANEHICEEDEDDFDVEGDEEEPEAEEDFSDEDFGAEEESEDDEAEFDVDDDIEEPEADEEPVEDEPVDVEAVKEVDEDDPDSIEAEIERLKARLEDLKAEEEPVEDEEEPAEEDEEEVEEIADEDEPEEEEVDGEVEECGNFCESKKAKFMDTIVESVIRSIKEDKLNDFGKHPGYRKKPMTLPATGEDQNAHGKDINDASAHSEEPFGQKKGNGDPFTILVDAITKDVMSQLTTESKKKVK